MATSHSFRWNVLDRERLIQPHLHEVELVSFTITDAFIPLFSYKRRVTSLPENLSTYTNTIVLFSPEIRTAVCTVGTQHWIPCVKIRIRDAIPRCERIA
jgi:hypothetical protein